MVDTQLSHLRGCEGLCMLGTLDVSHNAIRSLEALKPCQALPLLQSLRIDGNRMQTITHARLNVLNILPGLRTLGHQTVSSNEKARGGVEWGRERGETR